MPPAGEEFATRHNDVFTHKLTLAINNRLADASLGERASAKGADEARSAVPTFGHNVGTALRYYDQELKTMFVRDRMTTSVVTITSDTPLDRALNLLCDRHIRCLPVVDAAGHMLGLIDEYNLRRASAHDLETNVTVAQLMTRVVISTRPDLPLSDAARQMIGHHLTVLPVLDEQYHIVGLLTEADIFRTLIDLLETEQTALSAIF